MDLSLIMEHLNGFLGRQGLHFEYLFNLKKIQMPMGCLGGDVEASI